MSNPHVDVLKRLIVGALVTYIKNKERESGTRFFTTDRYGFMLYASERVMTILTECEDLTSIEEAIEIMAEEVRLYV